MAQRRRFALAAPVLHKPVADDAQARPPTPDDAEALAVLMHDAYRDTVDDEGESLEETRLVVKQLVDGEFGAMLWDASEVIERAGRVVAATLITRWQGLPFVAFTLTAPNHQGRGLARAGLLRSINRLAAAEETVLRLVVTQGNAPAERLYERLGFRPEAQPPFVTP
jgi:ribosomal protein S18 acetylase RimI-like enzyme